LGEGSPDIGQRQGAERFLREKDSMWLENDNLRRKREQGDTTSVSCSENEKLRTNLGKLLSFRRKGPFSSR